ncbi:MAG TPA: MFS transporter [Candidatus Limnocylindrales bacterium]
MSGAQPVELAPESGRPPDGGRAPDGGRFPDGDRAPAAGHTAGRGAGRAVGPSLRLARASVAAAFVANGVMFGSWAARIPAVKEQAGLDSVHLGFALFAAGIGAILAMPAAGALAGRVGTHAMTSGTLLGCSALMPLLAVAPSFVELFGILLAFGAFQGSMDVCMNTNGLAVERAGGRPILSRLHAAWSIGSFSGAFLTAVAIQIGLSLLSQFLLLAAGLAVTALVLTRTMLPDVRRGEGPSFRRPPRRVVALGLLAFAGLMAEGSASDWGGVFVKDSLAGTAQEAAIALAAFAAAMATARLVGDHLAARWGSARVVSWGGAIAAVGLGGAIVVASPIAAIVGLAFMGMGLAAIVPTVFRAGGSQPGISSAVGIAAVSTMGYAGGLAGPPLIGSVAGITGLRIALGGVAALLVLLALTGPRALGSAGDAPGRPAAGPGA